MSSCNDHDDDVIDAVTLDQLGNGLPPPLLSTLSTLFPFHFPFDTHTHTHTLHANWLKLKLDTRLVGFSPSIFQNFLLHLDTFSVSCSHSLIPPVFPMAFQFL